MGILHPDLLTKDMDKVLNDAATLSLEHKHPSIQLEILLLALINRPNTSAARLLKAISNEYVTDLDRLRTKVQDSIKDADGTNCDLEFVSDQGKNFTLSHEVTILLDESLNVAQAMHEIRIDTDHALKVLSQNSMSTAGLLHREGITPEVIEGIYTDYVTFFDFRPSPEDLQKLEEYLNSKK